MHSTVGAGATTGGTMDLATLIKPILTAGELRVIGSTTFEEFKHIEKDRALARRLQKIAVDEPSIDETVRSCRACAPATRSTTTSTYTDAALEAAARLAARHLRDYRLPDSAIDLIDEAGAGAAAEAAARTAAGASTCRTSSASSRAWRASPRPQASSSDRERLRTLEESLERVVFGQDEAVDTVAAAIKRSRAGLGQPDRPAGCFLFTGPTASARPSSPSSSRSSSATSSSAST